MTDTLIRTLAPGPERAFAATVDGRVVAVGGWNRLPDPQRGEVSLVLHDSAAETQAATLLREIAVDAARAGIRRFVNESGPDDAPVRRVIRNAGFVTATVYQQGVLISSFAI
ncbi:MAG: hypothetical protein QOF96_2704 [Actinomycetota bacterium]|jgi:hypothetical protein|nr:hypothetical protein [Actinomycetota bacterium]